MVISTQKQKKKHDKKSIPSRAKEAKPNGMEQDGKKRKDAEGFSGGEREREREHQLSMQNCCQITLEEKWVIPKINIYLIYKYTF